ncbi:MAG: Low affinity gluconate transporter [Euryarchaeota archaeon]|nr:Low affinity gluconate transporter [Euryarchaeota archaeon]
MDPFLAFLATVIFVSLIIPRLGPFLSLIISAIVFGLLVGMGVELQGYISTGLSRIFSSLAIVVFSGALLAEYLRSTESLDRIVADLRRLADKSLAIGGAAGYLISLPVMCSITAYMILQPVVSGLAGKSSDSRKRALFMTAAGSIISFNLIYPSPVMITLSAGLEAAPRDLLMRGIPISLVLFALAYILMQYIFPEKAECKEILNPPEMNRSRAWAPLLLPIAMILLGSLLPEKAHILADPGIALLLGAMLSLALERKKMQELIHVASRRSGVILLDLCGAGAFGYVVAQSGLSQEIFRLGHFLPALLLPFLLSALLQLAQGSRVVTATVATQILAGYPLPAVTLALLIASGAFMFSYVTDPFFWLIKSSTGSSMKQTVLGYTLPLSLLGLAAFALAAI